MANQLENTQPCLLISLQSNSKEGLYHSYRDYLVFMSLVRDGVRAGQLSVYGFCWIKNQSLLLVQPKGDTFGSFIIRLLKRYHYWLLQRGPKTSTFRLGILEFSQSSWILDCLRFIHQFAVKEQIVDDAMDYHWHSYNIYNGFWTLNWLDTEYILKKFAANPLVAMNRFRQYMLHTHRLNYLKMLVSEDVSRNYINTKISGEVIAREKVVAEINSHYHQSLIKRTIVKVHDSLSLLTISVSVDEQDVLINSKESMGC